MMGHPRCGSFFSFQKFGKLPQNVYLCRVKGKALFFTHKYVTKIKDNYMWLFLTRIIMNFT